MVRTVRDVVDVDAMRADLLVARKARDKIAEVAIKRCLAAIENAAAPPAQAQANLLGMPSGPTEVARLVLSDDDRAQILRAEIVEAEAAAKQYNEGGHAEAAERLRAECAVIAAHLD